VARRQADEFGEVAELKRDARARATRLGHVLGSFVLRRNNDTKSDAFCTSCASVVVVNTADDELPTVYGKAIERRGRRES
jgi:hypothetical protein